MIELVYVGHLRTACDFRDGLIERPQSFFDLARICCLLEQHFAFTHVIFDLLEIVHRLLLIKILIFFLFVNAHFLLKLNGISIQIEHHIK